MTNNSRPKSLYEVAARSQKEGFSMSIRSFLDVYYYVAKNAEQRQTMIDDEPMLIGQPEDTWLAATAEHLARRDHLVIPAWTEEKCRFLTRAFFAGGLENLKATLLVESPTAFRRRQLFVSANALSRA